MPRVFSGAHARARRYVATLSERRTWRCRAPVNNPLLMGFIYYVMIVAMIVLCASVQYRFFYGNF